MDSGHDHLRERRFEKFAAMLGDSEIAAEQGLGGGGTEADDYLGFEGCNFGLEPGAAGFNFRGAGLFVDAAFSSWFPFEMLYGIRDVNFLAIDSRCDERFVEKFAGGADERFAFEIFLIAGLLADHHHFCERRAFTENCLRGIPP